MPIVKLFFHKVEKLWKSALAKVLGGGYWLSVSGCQLQVSSYQLPAMILLEL